VRQQNANQIWMATTKAKYGAKQTPVLGASELSSKLRDSLMRLPSLAQLNKKPAKRAR
jgi:hypothetical protein